MRGGLHRWKRLLTGGFRCQDCGSTTGTRMDSAVFPCPGTSALRRKDTP